MGDDKKVHHQEPDIIDLSRDDHESERPTSLGRPVNLLHEQVAGRLRACLIVVAGDSVGSTFHMDGGDLLIGRAPTASMRIRDDEISRKHARIFQVGPEIWIEDLGSANGTRVNGDLITRVALQDGDKIQVGTTTVLKFSLNDALDDRFQENLLNAAQRDGLTKAFNKGHFLQRLKTEVAFAARHRAPLSLILMDLDHFKRINDTYGHLAGDTVLVEVARTVMGTLREEDCFARFGGEEFAILCRGISGRNAALLAERLRNLLHAMRIRHGDQAIPVTSSFGVAELVVGGASGSDLVAAADAALYRAKHSGRDRVEIHTPA